MLSPSPWFSLEHLVLYSEISYIVFLSTQWQINLFLTLPFQLNSVQISSHLPEHSTRRFYVVCTWSQIGHLQELSGASLVCWHLLLVFVDCGIRHRYLPGWYLKTPSLGMMQLYVLHLLLVCITLLSASSSTSRLSSSYSWDEFKSFILVFDFNISLSHTSRLSNSICQHRNLPIIWLPLCFPLGAGLCLTQVISAMSLLGLWNLTLVEPWIVARPTSISHPHPVMSSGIRKARYLNMFIPLR